MEIVPSLSLNLQGLLRIFESSTEERIIQINNAINIATINFKFYSIWERLTGFHCKLIPTVIVNNRSDLWRVLYAWRITLQEVKARIILLCCSWWNHFCLTVAVFTQEYKRVQTKCWRNVTVLENWGLRGGRYQPLIKPNQLRNYIHVLTVAVISKFHFDHSCTHPFLDQYFPLFQWYFPQWQDWYITKEKSSLQSCLQ